MESVESLDKVHGYSGQSSVSALRLDNVHELPGQCPWTQWKVWTMSMDTLDKVQGTHSDWTMSMDSWTLSTVSLENVHGLPGHCPWTQWKVWTLSTDTLDNVQADWTMSAESMGSLDIVHGQSPLFVLTALAK